MTNNAPILLFLIGIVISNLHQLSDWMKKRARVKVSNAAGESLDVPALPWYGYFTEQAGVLMANLSIDLGIGFLWAYNYMDQVVAGALWLIQKGTFGAIDVSAYPVTGIPFTPPVGLLLGFLSDYFGDRVAFRAVTWASAKVDKILGGDAGPV